MEALPGTRTCLLHALPHFILTATHNTEVRLVALCHTLGNQLLGGWADSSLGCLSIEHMLLVCAPSPRHSEIWFWA